MSQIFSAGLRTPPPLLPDLGAVGGMCGDAKGTRDSRELSRHVLEPKQKSLEGSASQGLGRFRVSGPLWKGPSEGRQGAGQAPIWQKIVGNLRYLRTNLALQLRAREWV